MASGSYLSGVWADEIYANKGATIGSIGVIMDGLNLGELADKIGIKPQVVKAENLKKQELLCASGATKSARVCNI